MTHDLVNGASRWIGGDDILLVAVALVLVVVAWWSEKVRVDRCRSERRAVYERLPEAVTIKRWRRSLQDSQA